jgi:DNA replication licensing factor MCM7
MVKGMVTRISDVKPQVSVVTYTCDSCSSEIYQEISGTQFRPIDKCPSQRCVDNDTAGKLQMQTRGSRFVKYQVGRGIYVDVLLMHPNSFTAKSSQYS